MSWHKRIAGWALPATAVLLTLASLTANAAPAPRGDGWHSWEVEAVDRAPAWCCYSWRDGRSGNEGCDLDDGNHNYSWSDEQRPATSRMSVYVRMDAGEAKEIRALAVDCPVRSQSAIESHGQQRPGESVAWLSRYIRPGGHIASQALAAIAVHDGAQAERTLSATARRDTSLKNRKDAVFWMGQVRALSMAGEIRDIMFNDAAPKMREHAAFSWSQADVPGRAAALRELGQRDENEKVRGQAWFWLAQTGDASAQDDILAGLRAEKSRHVRNQAIFALSQLPDERGVAALVSVVENRGLNDKDRRQALFWLAQSESPRAVDYLARVLQ